MRKIFLLTAFLTGCASQPIPMPTPLPPPMEKKCIVIPGQGCKQINAGNVGGTTLGNHDDYILEESSP